MAAGKRRNREHRQKSADRILVNARFSYICPYCLKEFYNQSQLCVDHAFPRSRFVETEKVLCCKRCNHEKGALTPAEYNLWKELHYRSDGMLTLTEMAIFQRLEDLRNGRQK